MNIKIILSFFLEIFFSISSFILAYMLRYNFSLPPWKYDLCLYILASNIIFGPFLIFLLGIYKISWRAISTNDLLKYTFLIISLSCCNFIFIETLSDILVPKSIYFLYPIIFLLFSFVAKFIYKFITFYNPEKKIGNSSRKNIFVVGYEKKSLSVIENLISSKNFNIHGILSSSNASGRTYFGLKVFDLNNINLNLYEIDEFIVDPDSVSSIFLKKLYKYAYEKKITILKIQNNYTFSKNDFENLEPFDINDLLGRKSVDFDFLAANKIFHNKVVFVTGAGGSIGSELSRHLLNLNCKKIVFIDNCELNLYSLKNRHDLSNCEFLLNDIKSFDDLDNIFSTFKPDFVFHAAAYKHVPLLENPTNSVLAFKNNVLGTLNLAKLSIKHNVKKFTLVSSDKAVNPTNIMGATKRISEIICSIYSRKSSTKFMIVRFGNVLGSSGSVVPLFISQIKNRGPVTITHKNITRYFMSIAEAAQLIITSCALGKGGEIFILNMGRRIKISHLVKNIYSILNITELDVPIKYIGLRPGEKLHEELYNKDQILLKTKFNKIKILKEVKNDSILFKSEPSFVKYLSNITSYQQLIYFIDKAIPEHKIINL